MKGVTILTFVFLVVVGECTIKKRSYSELGDGFIQNNAQMDDGKKRIGFYSDAVVDQLDRGKPAQIYKEQAMATRYISKGIRGKWSDGSMKNALDGLMSLNKASKEYKVALYDATRTLLKDFITQRLYYNHEIGYYTEAVIKQVQESFTK